MIPTIFLVSLIIFFMIRLIPGSIIDIMIGQQIEMSGVAMDRDYLERELGLDVPVYVQYGRWLGILPNKEGRVSGLLQGNLGDSLWGQTPVIEEIADRWPVTIELGLLALLVAQCIALPVGIISALRQDTWPDYVARSFAIICISVPAFWVGTMVIVFPSIWWGYMPSITYIRFVDDPIGNLKMFIVPAMVLGMAMSGMTMRMTRTMMLEVLRQDYIRTAWSKGLKEKVVVLRHALKNALIPVVTLVGQSLAILVGGTVIIEQIFVLPGMGRLIIDAVTQRDYTVVSAVMIFFASTMVIANLVVDLTYGVLDPRVHYK
jgi:peptide/nickel transport system permease protein